MIVFVYGTSGELIKVAPVIKRLEERGLRYISLSTEQQPTQIHALCTELGIRQPDYLLAKGFRGDDLSDKWHIFEWAGAVSGNFSLFYRRLRSQLMAVPGKHVVVVHGDTLTTVLGTMIGRTLRLPVAHLEAGLRSGDWRHPFPEELNRRVVTKLARIHYTPNAEATTNLLKVKAKGRVVDLGANTVYDSLALVPPDVDLLDAERDGRLPPGGFGIVSLHRFELLSQQAKFQEILELLAKKSLDVPMVFIDFAVTARKIEQYGLEHLFDSERFIRIPRLGYTRFVSLLKRTKFLVTDSGGAQEECYFLDRPCCVHRAAVERNEGMGENAVLSKMDIEVVRRFLEDPTSYRRAEQTQLPSPSDRMIENLEEFGVWRGDEPVHA